MAEYSDAEYIEDADIMISACSSATELAEITANLKRLILHWERNGLSHETYILRESYAHLLRVIMMNSGLDEQYAPIMDKVINLYGLNENGRI